MDWICSANVRSVVYFVQKLITTCHFYKFLCPGLNNYTMLYKYCNDTSTSSYNPDLLGNFDIVSLISNTSRKYNN